jgi:hypothetical protein
MAVQEPPYSDEFADTARKEVELLSVRVAELRARGERWIEQGEAVLAEAMRLEGRVRDLNELLGRAPQLRIDLQTQQLQGQQLRGAATQILLEHLGARRPIHYRAWYALFTEAGFAAAGKDGLATFLTQITRSPIVSRVEGESGIYELDPTGAYDRARAAYADATKALTEMQVSVPSSRETTERLTKEARDRLAKAKRTLDEVVEARAALRKVHFSSIALAARPS